MHPDLRSLFRRALVLGWLCCSSRNTSGSIFFCHEELSVERKFIDRIFFYHNIRHREHHHATEDHHEHHRILEHLQDIERLVRNKVVLPLPWDEFDGVGKLDGR